MSRIRYAVHHDVGGIAVEPVVVRTQRSLPGQALDGIYSVLRRGHGDPSRIYTLCRPPSRQALGPSTMELEEGPIQFLLNSPTSVRRPKCQSIMHISLA